MQKTLSVVNLTAIENNAKLVKNMLNGQKFYAVVKANAYGHGAERVALSLQHIVDGFCVAIAEEGAALRIAGITKPILVLIPPLSEYDVERLTLYGLTATVSNKFTAKLCKNVNCHVKINTGMNRLGCNISELYSVLNELNAQNVKGVYSHLYAPNCKKSSYNQLKIFNEAEQIVKSFSPKAIAHIAASGGILRGNDFLKNGVRCGILLYGYAPKGFKLKGLLPALKVYARLTQTTKFIGG
ncbi:MAG: alanine racemase, partial [Clostridia bacterium]|nr:alanine racemase [Clostridia bacterium]